MEVSWIRLSTDLFENRKIRYLETLKEGETMILMWIRLLALAGRLNDAGHIRVGEGLPYTVKMLAREFGRPVTLITKGLTMFRGLGMIE